MDVKGISDRYEFIALGEGTRPLAAAFPKVYARLLEVAPELINQWEHVLLPLTLGWMQELPDSCGTTALYCSSVDASVSQELTEISVMDCLYGLHHSLSIMLSLLPNDPLNQNAEIRTQELEAEIVRKATGMLRKGSRLLETLQFIADRRCDLAFELFQPRARAIKASRLTTRKFSWIRSNAIDAYGRGRLKDEIAKQPICLYDMHSIGEAVGPTETSYLHEPEKITCKLTRGQAGDISVDLTRLLSQDLRVPAFENEQLFGGELSIYPAYAIVPPVGKDLQIAVDHAAALYEELGDGGGISELADLHWWLLQSAPFEHQGSETVGLFIKSVAQAKGYNIEAWGEHLVMEGLVSEREDFIRKYESLVQLRQQQDLSDLGMKV